MLLQLNKAKIKRKNKYKILSFTIFLKFHAQNKTSYCCHCNPNIPFFSSNPEQIPKLSSHSQEPISILSISLLNFIKKPFKLTLFCVYLRWIFYWKNPNSPNRSFLGYPSSIQAFIVDLSLELEWIKGNQVGIQLERVVWGLEIAFCWFNSGDFLKFLVVENLVPCSASVPSD